MLRSLRQQSSNLPACSLLAVCILAAHAAAQHEAPPQQLAVRLLPPVSQLQHLADEAIVQRTVDLRDAIEAHVRESSLSSDEARAEALRYLFATPEGWVKSLIESEELAPGVFQISAPASLQNVIDANVGWLRHGKKQIVVESRFIKVTSARRDELHMEFAGAWETSTTGQATSETAPPVQLAASTMIASNTERSPFKFASLKTNTSQKKEFVSAVSESVRATPCRVAKLDVEQTADFVKSQYSNSSATIESAPKVTLFPEQIASIEDTVQRPFVVSVKPIEGELGTAFQPVIQVFTDGVKCQLRATPDDEQLRLDCHIVFTEIGDVEEFNFTPKGVSESVTVQIPHQKVRRVDLTQNIEDGASILVDPSFYRETVVKKRFRADTKTREYTLLLMTLRVIDDA